MHYDKVKKEAVPHTVGVCSPAGTTYRMAAMGSVWMNASNAWSYALKAMHVDTQTELDNSAQWQQSTKKQRKGGDQRSHSADSSWGSAKWNQNRDDSTGYDKWQSSGWQVRSAGPYTGSKGKGQGDKATGSYTGGKGSSSRSSSWSRTAWKDRTQTSSHSSNKDKDWHNDSGKWAQDSKGKWYKR